MAKEINTTVLGIFVVGASALALLSIGLFGSGRFFKPITRYVIFFPESVQGLKVGAEVEFRGVKVGSVVQTQAVFDPTDRKIIIPVYIEIDRQSVKGLVPPAQEVSVQQENILGMNLRAQLVTESFVTGQRAVALSISPGTEVRLVGADKTVAEIPSIPSPLEKISTQLESLPLDAIVNKLDRTLSQVEAAASAPGFIEGMNAFGGTMTEAKAMLAHINADLPAILKDLRQDLSHLNLAELSSRADHGLVSIEKAADELKEQTGPIGANANKALLEIAAAARELRQLAELLQRQPEAMIKGKK